MDILYIFWKNELYIKREKDREKEEMKSHFFQAITNSTSIQPIYTNLKHNTFWKSTILISLYLSASPFYNFKSKPVEGSMIYVYTKM